MKHLREIIQEKESQDSLDVKTYSPSVLAKKHNVSLKQIKKQIKMGIGVEKEHTTKAKLAREIARDHLKELPDYYTRLRKMEG